MSHATARNTKPATDRDDPELDTVLQGLHADPPTVSPRWFYDALGSALFEAITRVPEYYPTRSEIEILDQRGEDIGRRLPQHLGVIELGAGSAQKIGRLLPHLRSPRGYYPIDVSDAALDATEAEIGGRFPNLPVEKLHGDFTRPHETQHLVERLVDDGPVALFFPGSTLGNFESDAAARLLADSGRGLPAGTPFLLGVDLIKDPEVLEAAYDDSVGVTAAFNRNMLAHLNRRFDADFDPSRWRHEARWIPERRRVEMWLRSRGNQTVRIGETRFDFADGEGIHTESSHKWDRPSIEALARRSGWRVETWWTDANGWFAEVLLTRTPELHSVTR